MAGEKQFDENEVYDILRNERRRNVLRLLTDRGDGTTIGDLADRIAEQESGESPPPGDTRQSVYVSLHQTHLPKLANLGVVDYDREERTVELQPVADEVVARLNAGTGSGTSEAVVRLVSAAFLASVVGLVLVFAAGAGVPGIAAVGGATWGAVGLVVAAAASGFAVRELRE
jgi:hypothetical protein